MSASTTAIDVRSIEDVHALCRANGDTAHACLFKNCARMRFRFYDEFRVVTVGDLTSISAPMIESCQTLDASSKSWMLWLRQQLLDIPGWVPGQIPPDGRPTGHPHNHQSPLEQAYHARGKQVRDLALAACAAQREQADKIEKLGRDLTDQAYRLETVEASSQREIIELRRQISFYAEGDAETLAAQIGAARAHHLLLTQRNDALEEEARSLREHVRFLTLHDSALAEEVAGLNAIVAGLKTHHQVQAAEWHEKRNELEERVERHRANAAKQYDRYTETRAAMDEGMARHQRTIDALRRDLERARSRGALETLTDLRERGLAGDSPADVAQAALLARELCASLAVRGRECRAEEEQRAAAARHLVAKRKAAEAAPLVPDWVCSISQELMRDPVITALGHTYERESIVQWLKRYQTDPQTGVVLPGTRLITNHALRNTIEANIASQVVPPEQRRRRMHCDDF